MAKIYDINRDLIYEKEGLSRSDTIVEAINEGIDLKHANLYRSVFRDITLQDVDLSGVDISRCIFDNVQLSNVNLSGADIHDTVFRRTSFTDVDMSGADVSGIDFGGAGLSTINFLDAVLSYDGQKDEWFVSEKLRRLGSSSKILRSGDWMVGLSKDTKPSRWNLTYPNVYVVKRLPRGGFKSNPKDTSRILADRGQRYGSFQGHAAISQALQKVVAEGFSKREDDKTIQDMTDAQREALFMVLHKIARIVNGDFNYDDSWRDIAGYATLVVNELEGKNDQR